MSNGSTSSRSAFRLLAAVVVLFLILVGLGILYFWLTREPELATEQGTKDKSYLFSIYGFEGDLLRRPSSVDVDAQGNIYVADTGKKRIVVFDKDGKFVTTYGDFGKDKNQLWEPIDVAVAPDGRSYVLDKTLRKIVMYDAQKAPTKEITFPDAFPLSAAVANDRLYITTESGVMVSDLEGNLVTGYIDRGKKPGQFDLPGGVAVADDGTMYVADSLNYRVQAMKNGKSTWQYGEPLPPDKAVMYRDESRKFGLPSSIALDENGYLYVVDGLNSEIVVLNDKGEFIEKMGDVGHADGAFYYPDGIAYNDGRLVVADKFNDRVEVFRLPTAAASVTQQPTRWIPWILLLLLIPLLLLLFSRRRTTYVATPAFVTALGTAAEGAEVAKGLGKISVTPKLAAIGQAFQNLKVNWKTKDPDAERVSKLVERYGVTEDEAEALELALSSRGKRVLLSEEEAVRQAATELGVSTLSYEDLAQVVGDEGPSAGDDTPPGDEGEAS